LQVNEGGGFALAALPVFEQKPCKEKVGTLFSCTGFTLRFAGLAKCAPGGSLMRAALLAGASNSAPP